MTGETISGAAQTADPNAPKTAQKAPKAKAKKASLRAMSRQRRANCAA